MLLRKFHQNRFETRLRSVTEFHYQDYKKLKIYCENHLIVFFFNFLHVYHKYIQCEVFRGGLCSFED